MKNWIGKKASILILTVWTLTFLGTLTAVIGLSLRQKIRLASDLEHRSQLSLAAQSGIKKAMSLMRTEVEFNQNHYTVDGKIFRHNNPAQFQNFTVGNIYVNISYDETNNASTQVQEKFGFVDELSKLNINVVTKDNLFLLFKNVLNLNDQEAAGLVGAVVDWRDPGRGELLGFYSDDYYENLETPYPPKNSPFELLEELFLVKGMDEEKFKKLLPYMTIYGNGQININTASEQTLLALGIPSSLVEKILFVRRGKDALEATPDDVVFQTTYDILSDIQRVVVLTPPEVNIIDFLNKRGVFSVNSPIYRLRAQAENESGEEVVIVNCIYDAYQNRILFWNEKKLFL